MLSLRAFVGALALILAALAPATATLSQARPAPQLADPSDPTSPEDSDGSTADQSSVPTSLDPCQLVTSDEASALAGTTYGPGTSTPDDGGGATCVYGSQTLNVFMVSVGQAPDAATAQAAWADEEARAQNTLQGGLPPGVNVNLTFNDVANLPGYDRAALTQGSGTVAGRTVNASGIYLLKGATFVAFSDLVLDQPAPTGDAMQAEAETVLGRLP